MKTAAIIAEYNPFHRGHAWQVQSIRQMLGADCAILAAMSGCFTQRGEPAVLDKWSRTRMALAGGVDLVIELPFAYAAASAERFAEGGVRLVEATGLDCHLVFGSESGELPPLQQLAELLVAEPAGFKILLHRFLDEGESFPAARQKAVAAWTGQPGLAALLKESNNILAVEYLKALRDLPKGRITPVTMQRQGQAYRDSSAADTQYASASAIRQILARHLGGPAPDPACSRHPDLAGLFNALAPVLPPSAFGLLMEQVQTGPGPVFFENLAPLVLGLLRIRSVEELVRIPGMGEGLAQRLTAAARRPGLKTDDPAMPGRLAGLLSDSATRRFPQTRIQRALLAMMTGLQTEDLQMFDQAGGPQYLRILGFSRQGRHMLKIMRQTARRPILMKGSDFLEHQEAAFVRMAQLDCLGTDLWMLAAGQSCGRDFDTPVVMG